MARHGVTFQDIVRAIQEIKGQGKNITIENIRAFLGTGSIGTINKYLRQWREMEKSVGNLSSSELPETLFLMVKNLWQNILTQSAQQFELMETNYKQEIIRLKTEVEKYRRNNQRWQTLFNQWQLEKAKLENEKSRLEQALACKDREPIHETLLSF